MWSHGLPPAHQPAQLLNRWPRLSESASYRSATWFYVLGKINVGLADIAWLSPFHYYLGSDPFTNGMAWGNAGVLALLSVALCSSGETSNRGPGADRNFPRWQWVH